MTKPAGSVLRWEADVPLLSHPLMLANFAKLLAISGLVMAALLSGLLAVTDGADAIVPMLGLTAVVLAGVGVLFVLVSLAVFRNRMHMRFTLDGKTALAEMFDRRAKAANRLAMVAGVLGGKPGVTGAGLLAEANSEQHIAWNAVASARYYKSWRAITLSNSWRVAVTLYCTAENYPAAAAMVEAALAARPAAAKAKKASPLPKLLLLTVLTIVASAPLFGLPDTGDHAVFPALIVLCFALAALWLIPVMGWAVFAGLGWLAWLEIAAQNEVRTSFFDGRPYRAYEVMSGDDIAMLVAAGLGAAFLIWLCVGLMRGVIRSGLIGDMDEADG